MIQQLISLVPGNDWEEFITISDEGGPIDYSGWTVEPSSIRWTKSNSSIPVLIDDSQAAIGVFRFHQARAVTGPLPMGAGATYALNALDPAGKRKTIYYARVAGVPIATTNTLAVTHPGTQGPRGYSAHDLWLAQGNAGTVEDFLDSLIGSDGLSAHEIYVEHGGMLSEEDWNDAVNADRLAAEAARDLARDWAIKGTDVETGQPSAKTSAGLATTKAAEATAQVPLATAQATLATAARIAAEAAALTLGATPYATKALMDAVTPSGPPKLAYVYADGTTANNGLYVYPVGGPVWVKDLLDAATRLALAEAILLPTTSYANPGGTGDRRAYLSAVATGLVGQTGAAASNAIDGDLTNDGAHAVIFTGINNDTGANWHTWMVSFPRGSRIVMDEWMIRHAYGFAGNHGVFEIVGRNRFDDAAWSQLAQFTLGPPSTSGTADANVKQFVKLNRVVELGRVKGFDTFALRGVSGSYSSGGSTDRRLVEIEFKIGYAVDHLKPALPDGGTADQALLKGSADSGDLSWAAVNLDPEGTGLRSAMHGLQESQRAEKASRSRYFLDSTAADDTATGENTSMPKKTIGGLVRKIALTKGSFTKTGGFTNVYQITVDRGATPWPRGSRLAPMYLSGTTLIELVERESIAEVDTTAGQFFVENPTAKVSIIYLANGGNPAVDSFTYMAFITPPKSGLIGLRSGSVFSDKSLEPPLGYTRIGAVGDAPMPFIDCGATIAPGAWTQDSTYPELYWTDISRETEVRWLNDPRYVLFEIDAQGRVWPAEEQTTRALAGGRAGASYFGNPAAIDTRLTSGATVRVFYRPRFSTDPRSDGKTYRYNKLKAGVSVHSNANTGGSQVFDGVEIEGVKSGWQQDGHGSILASADAIVRRCLGVWGQKHAFISMSGSWEDCIAFGGHRGSSDIDFFPFTFYRAGAAQIEALLQRTGTIFPDHYPFGSRPIYSHGSDGFPVRKSVFEQFFSHNCGYIDSGGKDGGRHIDTLMTAREDNRGVYASVAAIQAIAAPLDGDLAYMNGSPIPDRSWYRYNAALAVPAWEKVNFGQGGNILLGATADVPAMTTTIERPMIRGASSIGAIVLNSATGPSNSSRVITVRNGVLHGLVNAGPLVSWQVGCKFTVENNLLIVTANSSYAAALSLGYAGSSFRRNIIYDTRPYVGQLGRLWGVELDGASVNTAIDYNVYVTPASRQIYVGGVSYTMNTKTSFAAYKAAVAAQGIDQNSIWLDADDAKNLFVGDPATGDCRLRKGNLRFADGSPMVFTDGTPVNVAGPQQHRDWNSRAILPGAPAYWPISPRNETDCELYCRAPWLWDWKTGTSKLSDRW